MKKVAVFTEGQSDMIFVRNYLKKTIDNARLSFDCITLHGGKEIYAPYPFKPPRPDFYFLIVNAENDTKVMSAMMEREVKLFEKGYMEIIGLRDMYSREYRRKSPSGINDTVSRRFIKGHNDSIQKMSNSERISIFFSIMELEAWFLSMYNLFAKINAMLSVNYIETKMGYNLRNIDPQQSFFRPAKDIRRILQLCGIDYRKSVDNIEKITNNMGLSDFENAFEGGRCQSFRDFFQKLQAITTD